MDKRLTLTVFFRGQKRDLKFPILHKPAIIGMENDDTISTESVFFPTKTVYHKNTEGTRGEGGIKVSVYSSDAIGMH